MTRKEAREEHLRRKAILDYCYSRLVFAMMELTGSSLMIAQSKVADYAKERA